MQSSKGAKRIHCPLQSKGKESRVRQNHSTNNKNNPHHRPFPCQIQTARSPKPTSTTIHFFSQFCRFGYKMLLLIEFFCWVCLNLIHFCFGFMESLSKCLFSQFQIFAFLFLFFLVTFFRLQKSLKILFLVWVLLFLMLTKSLGLNKNRIECCIDIYFRFFFPVY